MAADSAYRQALEEGLRGQDLWNARAIARSDAEVDLAEADYDEVKTQIILDRARRKDIPIPPRLEDSEYWYRSGVTNEFYLTTEGMFELNADMRRLRNDIWQFRIQFAVVIAFENQPDLIVGKYDEAGVGRRAFVDKFADRPADAFIITQSKR